VDQNSLKTGGAEINHSYLRSSTVSQAALQGRRLHLLNIRQGAQWLHAGRGHPMQCCPPCRAGVQQQGQAAGVACTHGCRHTVAPAACSVVPTDACADAVLRIPT
jgi:hypothetical protein